LPAPKLLSVYLQDHHAGAVTGLNLARRAAGQNEGTPYGAELARVANEIEQDLRTLEELMESLGIGTDRIKDSVAWTAEKLGRLKPNARWFSYSPLSRLVELEGLVIGVTAKLGLWRALRRVAAEVDGLAAFDFTVLETRAEDQRARLDELRLRAAAEAMPQD
jgi:hypothetical protein